MVRSPPREEGKTTKTMVVQEEIRPLKKDHEEEPPREELTPKALEKVQEQAGPSTEDWGKGPSFLEQ